ncbi:MAG: response regulator [Gammaproteobacteria bacterium]|nr:response regulator [Gammaproteobacteria bacterium]
MLKLTQANEIKSQFLANMSHEIRTPLTAVIGQAEAIIAGDMPSDLLINEVDIILKNSNHLLMLVNDILDLSRIEANKLELNLHHHDLHLELDAISDLFVEQAKVKGLSFNIIEKLPRPLVVKIDRVRLKQILINLCSNAIKFTYNGSVEVTVAIEDCQLIFKVTDTGIGLSEQQLPYVFDSFSQADSSINRRFGGSGLGLCLSQQLATLMGGHIDVTSEVNQGSTFTLTIACPDCDCSDDLMAVASPSTIEKYNGPNLTGLVLLADDHQDNRRMIARLLTTVGLEVISAKNGCEVIELAQRQQPDLILLDIQMPEMDGLEAFNILRAQGFQRPIIALTANAMHHEIEQYLAIGFDDYLSKPIERGLFIDTVAFFLKQTTQLQLEQIDMSDLAADFVAGLADEIIKLEHHLGAEDYVSVALLIHRIGGAAAMFGFADIAKLAGTIELKIKIKQQQQANILLVDFFELANQLSYNHSIGPN